MSGDNLGFSGHKHFNGDKVVAFCDKDCNVVAPFVSAPGNRNEYPLLLEALPELSRLAREVGLDLHGTVISLDGAYDSRVLRHKRIKSKLGFYKILIFNKIEQNSPK